MIFEIVSALGLAFGAALGLGSLLNPDWAARTVRLVEDPARDGGYSEFRATYGGLLLMTHATALAALVMLPPTLSTIGVVPLAAGWLGAAFGRTLSLILDGDRLRSRALIPVWIATEIGLAIAIGLPVLQFV